MVSNFFQGKCDELHQQEVKYELFVSQTDSHST